MSSNVVWGVDFKAKKKALEQQAVEIKNVALIGDAEEHFHMPIGPPVIADTAPSEYCAPDDDCA